MARLGHGSEDVLDPVLEKLAGLDPRTRLHLFGQLFVGDRGVVLPGGPLQRRARHRDPCSLRVLDADCRFVIDLVGTRCRHCSAPNRAGGSAGARSMNHRPRAGARREMPCSAWLGTYCTLTPIRASGSKTGLRRGGPPGPRRLRGCDDAPMADKKKIVVWGTGFVGKMVIPRGAAAPQFRAGRGRGQRQGQGRPRRRGHLRHRQHRGSPPPTTSMRWSPSAPTPWCTTGPRPARPTPTSATWVPSSGPGST